ncbi:hypothetical protein FB561_5723 [Kribbella amoyensis]|uniref:Uncharacterized protein n=1 Tax=Kribbella amoyensis TaxID=996641 RepID=A0A561C065_9ACTN|nr:hypothetical protein [Kribbella amoyensis]TWD84531.1 hypothetical protein FB561_5723 [Kribbella amoyensis]
MTSAHRSVLPPNFLDDDVRHRLDGGTFAFDRTGIGAATRRLDSPDLVSKDAANTLTCHEEMGCIEDFFGGVPAAVPVRGLRRPSRWL